MPQYPIVPVTSSIIDRLLRHTGTTNPKKIMAHFDVDEAEESKNPKKEKAKDKVVEKVAETKPDSDFDFDTRDFVKSKAKGNEPGIDLSGLSKVIKDLSKSDKDLVRRANKTDSNLTMEEMDRAKALGVDEPYSHLKFDGTDGRPKSLSQKIKAVTVKEGDKKPVTVEKKEITATPGSKLTPTGRKVEATPNAFRHLQMSKMASGEAAGSGSGLFNIGKFEVGPEDLAMAGMAGLGGLRKAAAAGGEALAKEAAAQGGRPMGGRLAEMLKLGGKKEGGSLEKMGSKAAESKVYEPEIIGREGLPAVRSGNRLDDAPIEGLKITDRLKGVADRKALNSPQKMLSQRSGQSKEEIRNAIKQVRTQYGKSAQSGDKETLKTLRFKLNKLQKMLEE